MYAQYMCILLYMKLMWCNGILWILLFNWSVGEHVSSVYVYSPTGKIYFL